LEILNRRTRITRNVDSYEIIMAVIPSYSYKLLPLSSRSACPNEPVLKACPKMLLFGVSCSGILFGGPARDLALKVRCALKNKKPLIVLKFQEAKIGTDQFLRSVPFFAGSRFWPGSRQNDIWGMMSVRYSDRACPEKLVPMSLS